MKTINSLRSKLLALTLALIASVSTFAYEFEYSNDFHIDGFAYKVLPSNTLWPYGAVALIEIADCTADVIIPDTITYTFSNTTVTYIVTTLGGGAALFTNSAKETVKSISIPKGISVINSPLFAGCSNLTSIVVDSENHYYDSRENCNAIITTAQNPYFTPNTLIAGCKTTNILNSVAEIGDKAFYNSAIESITIPTGVTKIGRSAFNKSNQLSSVTLPASLKEIGYWAFADCLSLNTIICYAIEPPTISSNTFFGSNPIYNNPTIYVPAESVEAYKNAEHWKWFTKILPIEPTSYKSQWCNQWNILEYNVSGMGIPEETWRYYLAEDITINGTTYTTVNRYWTADKTKCESVATIRFTENQKVYALLGDTEYLVYDFSVQVGDTIETIVGVNYGTMLQQLLVHQIDIDGATNRKTITLYPICKMEDGECDDCDEDGHYLWECCPIEWIEGIGSTDGFLMGYPPCGHVGGIGHKLLCAYKDDELQYINELYQDDYGCEYNAGQNPEDLFPTLWGLRRTHTIEMYDYAPNDGKRSGGYPLSFAPVKDTIINGKTYLQFSDKLHELDYSLFFLREENNKVLIYSSILQDDLVLYDYTLEVGDSLYTIEGYDWFDDVNITKLKKTKDAYVVTDVSTITLSDGIERKKWSLYKGYTPLEYVEGIGCFGENLLSWSGDFFRLITNYPYIAESVGDHLVCVSKNGQLLYSMTKDEMNSFTWTCECLSEKDTTYYKSKWCDTWNVLELKYRYSSYTTKEDFETWRYYLAQDTIINNYTYTAVTRQTTKVPEGVYPFTIPEPEYVAAVRFTDDRKVYIYYDNTEYLLYDFNVQPGDELTVFAGINHYHSHHTNTIRVDEVFGTEISLSVFPDFYGDERPACFGVTKWVEGVGDLCGFITGADCGLSDDQSALLCAYKEGNQEYSTELEEYAEYGCEYNTASGEYTSTLAGLQRTVYDEFCGEAEIGAAYTGKQTFDKIFFENDKPYILCNDYLLHEEDNKILIYSQLLNKDLVLYDFTLEVGDSLPALYIDYHARNARNAMDWMPYNPDVVDYNKDFDGTIYPADTFVVTDISNVTLLDGKEYKKWTFDNGMEYVEGIGMYGGRRNGDFFGLIREVVVPCHIGTHLVCVSKNNKLLYQMDDAEMERLGAECLCDYDRGPRKDNAKNGKIGGRPTPTQWNMLEVETKEMDGTPTILRAETFSYTLENDSLVANNKTFYQLARQSTKDTAITKSFVGALHFGEDEDNRVYFLRDGVEYVLYDFTAEPGDTIEIFAGINNYPQYTTYTHVVTGKDTLENGACRMMLEVVFPEEIGSDLEQQHLQKIWLAGLGSIDGIVHNAAQRTSDVHAAPAKSASSETQSSVMLCAWREDSCLYTTNHPEYDTFGCVYNQDPTAVENLTSPSSYQKIIHEGTLLILHEGKVYNVIGIQIK